MVRFAVGGEVAQDRAGEPPIGGVPIDEVEPTEGGATRAPGAGCSIEDGLPCYAAVGEPAEVEIP